MSLAGAGVALIVLIDIATGQGPPGLNTFMAGPGGPMPGPPIEYRPPMPPMNYGPRPDFDGHKKQIKEKEEKEFKELKKPINEPYKPSYGKKEEKEDKLDKYDEDSTTPKPGMWDSISNSWTSLTGRRKRAADHKEDGKSSGARGFDLDSSVDDGSFKTFGSNQAYIFFKVPRNLVCFN